MSLLLSNCATVLSELSDLDDMEAYRGVVRFCDYAILPRCHAQLQAAVPPWEEVLMRFAENFSAISVFARAGVATGVFAPLLAGGVESVNATLSV